MARQHPLRRMDKAWGERAVTGFLRRYTDVLSLLDIVRHNRITLLSPARWYDQNDTFGLTQYSRRKGDGSAYALCMTEGPETGHHWQLFAGHGHGLCIHFDRDEFLEFLDDAKGPVLHGPMQYRNLKEVRDLNPIPTDALPFLKRDTFKSEAEYRVVAWEEEIFAEDAYIIPMSASMIKKVTFGPAMPENLAFTLKDVVSSHDECNDIQFSISKLVNNKSWHTAIVEGMQKTRG